MSELHSEACKAFDKRIADIQALVQPMPPDPSLSESRPKDPDQHIAMTLTEADIIGAIELGKVDPFGNAVEKWVDRDGEMIGLGGEAFQSFELFCRNVQQNKVFRDKVSQEFIEKRTFDWLTTDSHPIVEYSKYIQEEADKAVVELEHWILIANLRTTRPFRIGKVEFKRITKKMIDAFEQSLPPAESADIEDAMKSFIQRLRRKVQGFTAGTITMTAEIERGRELAYKYVETALSMLRFFEPASIDPNFTCHLMPFGQEFKGTKSSFVVDKGVLSQWTEGVITKTSMQSVYDSGDIDDLEKSGLTPISDMLLKDKNTPYETKLIEALIIYSRVSISPRLSDKLVYALVALESIFLRDQSESIQQNLGERIAFLIGQNRDDRIAIVKLIKEIYGIRSRVIHHGKNVLSTQPVIDDFFKVSVSALYGLINNVKLYTSTDALLSELDRRKMT